MSAFGIEVGPDLVCVYGPGASKREALDQLVDKVASSGAVADKEGFRRAVHEREAVMSTGLGSGVAIPHVRADEVLRPCVGVGVSASGIDYDTLDNSPVHVMVLFAMPSWAQREYLGLLAQVMTSLKTPGFRERLVACKTPNQVAEHLTAQPE
jgi:mannitol/fructose-specific phosphotransferase system IIA component (Ntr-type)